MLWKPRRFSVWRTRKPEGSDSQAKAQGISASVPGHRQGEREGLGKCLGRSCGPAKTKEVKAAQMGRREQKAGTTATQYS